MDVLSSISFLSEGSNDGVVVLFLFMGLAVKATGKELILFGEDFHLQQLEILLELPPIDVREDSSFDGSGDGHGLDDELFVLLVEADQILSVADEILEHFEYPLSGFNEFSFSLFISIIYNLNN